MAERVCQQMSLINYLAGLTLLRASLVYAVFKIPAAAQWLEGSPYCKHCKAWTSVSVAGKILQGVPKADKA